LFKGWRCRRAGFTCAAVLKLLIFGAAAVLAAGAGQTRPANDPAPDFWRQPTLDQPINHATFDRQLMARAIFHETNRVREKLGLRPFGALPKLDEAADLEASVGKVYQPPSHTNPFPLIGTPLERVKFVGLNPGQVAENIALLSIYDLGMSVGVGMTIREGRRYFVHPETHEELKPATYRKFAANVVQGWMDSPPHRANIVNPALLYLGCSVQPTTNLLGVGQLFCVQVFFTPGN
jgi:uncharacterized protein YkwD